MLKKILFLIASIVIMTNVAMTQCEFQLIVRDNGAGIDTLIFGLHSNATYCIDSALGEFGLPPAPPGGVFDSRFTKNGPNADCLDQGVSIHFQPPNVAKDTFKVTFQPGGDGYPFHFSWNSGLDAYFTTLTWKDALGTVDMLANTSYDLEDADVNTARIIGVPKSGACVTGVIEKIGNDFPQEFALANNYPNPFNPITNIAFAIEKRAFVTISVYDILGKEISTLVSEDINPGFFNVVWNGTTESGLSVSSGTYYIRMNAKYSENGIADEFSSVRKILLMK